MLIDDADAMSAAKCLSDVSAPPARPAVASTSTSIDSARALHTRALVVVLSHAEAASVGEHKCADRKNQAGNGTSKLVEPESSPLSKLQEGYQRGCFHFQGRQSM